MSKKKKIIISIVSAVLALASLVPVVVFLTTDPSTSGGHETQDETLINENNTGEDTIPPIEFPSETDTKDLRDDIILDVGDIERDPEPGVIDAVVEYETKGVNRDDE